MKLVIILCLFGLVGCSTSKFMMKNCVEKAQNYYECEKP
jgi:hypothetical protein